jgi:single-strand DNA-binding protein
MASVNRVILVGNCGNDPEIRYMPNGEPVANFSIATTDVWKDKQGEKQERTEWHRIVAYRKLAEIVEAYVKKGTSVFIEGRIQSGKYTDKEGVERATFQIITEQLRLLGSNPSAKGSNQPQNSAPMSQPQMDNNFDEEAPF